MLQAAARIRNGCMASNLPQASFGAPIPTLAMRSWRIAGSPILKALDEKLDLPINEYGEPVFGEPWQAQAFAMALALHERGLFSWSEWAEALGAEIATGEHGDGEHGYYQAWLATLETIVQEKQLATDRELQDRHRAWKRAALSTPHGQPIELLD